MTITSTITCNSCGREMENHEYLNVDVDYKWPPDAPPPSKARLYEKSSGLLLSVGGEGRGRPEIDGKLYGQFCSWKCARAMLKYIEKHDTRTYLRTSE